MEEREPCLQEAGRSSNMDSRVTGAIDRPVSGTTRSLKAAKTRAFRTKRTFTANEAEVMSPSNVFVRLEISASKLKQSGIPSRKTRWEERITQAKAAGWTESQPMFEDSEAHDCGSNPPSRDMQQVKAENLGMVNSLGWVRGCAKEVPGSVREPRQLVQANQPPFDRLGLQPNLASKQSHRHVVPVDTSSSQLISESTDPETQEISPIQVPDTHENIGTRGSSEADQILALRDQIHRAAVVSIQSRDSQSVESRFSKPTKYKNAEINNEVGIAISGNDASEDIKAQLGSASISDSTLVKQVLKRKSVSLFQRGGRQAISPKRPRNSFVDSRGKFDETGQPTPAADDPKDLPDIDPDLDMAPVRDPNNVDGALKDAIQKLYEVQSQVHGFVPETQPLLIDKMTELAHSLSHLQTLTSPTLSPNNPIHKNRIAPEVIDYVDDSRNPDIYNREFVELVQRGNAVMNGKQQAFRDFSYIFANTLREKMPELTPHVDRIMANAELNESTSSTHRPENESANGASRTDNRPEARREGGSGVNGAREA